MNSHPDSWSCQWYWCDQSDVHVNDDGDYFCGYHGDDEDDHINCQDNPDDHKRVAKKRWPHNKLEHDDDDYGDDYGEDDVDQDNYQDNPDDHERVAKKEIAS